MANKPWEGPQDSAGLPWDPNASTGQPGAGKKSTPQPPDYKGAAEAETRANRPNISTPGSETTWEQGPDGQWHMKQAPSAAVQKAYDGMGQMDWGQFGTIDDGASARDQAVKASYDQAASRLNPAWDQREGAMRSRLANQGLDPNSEAARNAMRTLGQQRNDAFSGAMNSAIGQGREAGDSVFRNSMMSRQQAIIEALRKRGQPLEDIQQLMGFMRTPDFKSSGGLLQASGMQGDAEFRAYVAKKQAEADAAKGVSSIPGSVAPFLL